MPKYSPDFSQEFKPLVPGSYTAIVKSYEEKTSQKGDIYLQWVLEVVESDYAGGQIWLNTMMSGRGAGMIKHFLKTCDGVYDGGPFEADDYINSRVGIEVVEREYNGKKMMNVANVYPVEQTADATPDFESDIPF